MKYLQVDALAALTAQLQERRVGQRLLQGRIEAFTMKRAGGDKKYAADLGSRYVEQQESFENEWRQLAATSAARSVVTDDDESQKAKPKRGRSQSVGIYQDLSRDRHRAKQARSSSFDGTLPPPRHRFEVPQQPTPLGDLRDMSTRRLMTDLILTLNMSFPDYDFSTVQPSDFVSVSLKDVMNGVYSQLSPFLYNGNETDAMGPTSNVANPGTGDEGGSVVQPGQSLFLADLWKALDELMQLKDCDIYLWNNTDIASEELWLWSFHYFFVNKNLKRVVFFTCSESMQGQAPAEGDEVEGDDESGLAQVVVRPQRSDDVSDDANFDLDPSATRAGGFSLSVV